MSLNPNVVLAAVVPPFPHPLFKMDGIPEVTQLKQAYEDLAKKIKDLDIDFLLLYSTKWISVLGHQIQASQNLNDVFVDQDFHGLGSAPYSLSFCSDFAAQYVANCQNRGLAARTIDYQGFPVDAGSLAVLKLINLDKKMSVGLVSCNMYSDRNETIVLGKAARQTLKEQGKRAAVIAISALSNRSVPTLLSGKQQKIALPRDDEWNQKIIELLKAGRLEDVSQLARRFDKEARADQRFKAIWWLGATAGEHNSYTGTLHTYTTIQGCGAAVISIEESPHPQGDLEFDEESAEVFVGERGVLNSQIR